MGQGLDFTNLFYYTVHNAKTVCHDDDSGKSHHETQILYKPITRGWAEGKGLTTSQLPLKVQSPHPTEDRFRGSTWCTEGRLKFVTWWVYGEVVSES